MAKWYGAIAFANTVETAPGVWTNRIIKRNYYGELTRSSRRLQTADQLNDNITLANDISIISDPFAEENFQSILYVEIMGAKWKVSNVEIQYPRLLLTTGGIYNGEQA